MVSIHAPRVGRDVLLLSLYTVHLSFQSTRPVWGATNACRRLGGEKMVSIHAPRVGRDFPSSPVL